MWKPLITIPLLLAFFSCRSLPPQTINSYQLYKTISIEGIEDLSGITYSPHTQSYWVVNNSPSLLLEINEDGEILRQITFSQIHDTEDVTWIQKNLFAIVEESQNRLFIFDINLKTKNLSPKDAIHVWQAPGVYLKNKGLESVAYNPSTKTLLCASEKSPIKVFELNFSTDGLIGKQVFKKVKFGDTISDLAAIGLHKDKTLFLSEEKNMLLFLGKDQKEKGRIYLHKGFNGLKESVPQAEGIFVNNTYLQICSEPNKIYIFKKQP